MFRARHVLHTLGPLWVGQSRSILLVALVSLSLVVGPAVATAQQLNLSWVDNSGGQAGFIVQRATGTGGAYSQIGQLPAGVVSYADTAVLFGTTYCYQVAAVNSDGESAFSNVACGSPSGGFTLTTTKAGTGAGTVASSPAGITCGVTCSYTYPAGKAVTLTATPSSGSTFSGWSGGGCSGTAPCTLVGNGSVTTTATFATAPPAPTVTSVTPNQGAVGATVPVTINGSEFATGANVSAGAGITVANVSVGSGAQLTATLAISSGAALGIRDVIVSNPGGGSGTLTGGFTVAGGGAKAVLQTPAPGSVLPAGPVTFTWSAGSGVSQYRLDIGTASGGIDLYHQSQGTSLSGTVGGLPTTGQTLYVRLWSLIGGVWQFNDYTYTAFGTTCTPPTKADIQTPAPGATLVRAAVGFTWSEGCQVAEYWLSVGTAPGGTDLYHHSQGTSLSGTVGGLPTTGQALYVRLWSRIGGVWLFNDYTYRAATVVTSAVTSQPGFPADYDGDGKTDIAVYRPSNGTWYIINSATSSVRAQQWGVPGDIPVPGDYDGDGKTDIAAYRPSTGEWFIIQSSNGAVREQQWGVPGDIPVPGDYDGDGKTDLAAYRPSTGEWFIISSRTGAVRAQQWGVPGDRPVPGDYDGDGKTDIAVYHPSTGGWFIINSSTGGVTAQQWGVPGDIPVPGDYDGDGKTDIAAYRPSTGEWFIIQSSNGAVREQQWGMPGDIPVPGDYDGDGKTDIAAYRPSTGEWFIIHSSTGSVQQQQWGAGGDQPLPEWF